MIRREDWAERLYDYLDERRYMPFAWGDNDCCSFAAGAVEAMTGERPPLPQYRDALSAARLLDERSIHDWVADIYGIEIPASLAQRGDIVLMLLAGRETLGICAGELMCGPGVDHLTFVPRETAVCAWRVV